MTHELLSKGKTSRGGVSAWRAKSAKSRADNNSHSALDWAADRQLRRVALACIENDEYEKTLEQRRAARPAPLRWTEALLRRAAHRLGKKDTRPPSGGLSTNTLALVLALGDTQTVKPKAEARLTLLNAVAARGGVDTYRRAASDHAEVWRVQAKERDHDKKLLEYLTPALQPHRARLLRHRRKTDVMTLRRLGKQLSVSVMQLYTLTDSEKDFVAGVDVAAAARQAVATDGDLHLETYSIDDVRAANRLLAKAEKAAFSKAERKQAAAVNEAVERWLHARESRAFAASLIGLPEEDVEAHVTRLKDLSDPLSCVLWETAVGFRAQYAAARSENAHGIKNFIRNHQERLERKRASMPLRVFNREKEGDKLKQLEVEARFLYEKEGLAMIFGLFFLLPFTKPEVEETQPRLAEDLPEFLKAKISDVDGLYSSERLERLLLRVEDEKQIRTVRDMVVRLGRDGLNSLLIERQKFYSMQARGTLKTMRKAARFRSRGGVYGSITSCLGLSIPNEELASLREEGQAIAREALELAAEYAAYERVLNLPCYAQRFAAAERIHSVTGRLGIDAHEAIIQE
ncbi:hypothetical protein [Streptomyces sp. MS2.AVA.5]|uniref:Uncharacterized protein n=1 Tax=Streptomyces achmelvichensis TaxID=3134111 RepID=A0ACC6Q8W8_9ACTN